MRFADYGKEQISPILCRGPDMRPPYLLTELSECWRVMPPNVGNTEEMALLSERR